MLMELRKVQQRYDAVLDVIRGGLTVTEVAKAYGVTRQSVYSWLNRYEDGGLEALAEQTHRPRSCPHQITPVIEARILEMRRQHPSWGPIRLVHPPGAGTEEGHPPPTWPSIGPWSAMTLLDPKSMRKKLPNYKRWERGRDHGALADGHRGRRPLGGRHRGARCSPASTTTADTVSAPASWSGPPPDRSVCFFGQALEHHAVPEEILTDNGKVFTARFGLKPTEVLFDRICHDNGIKHRLTAPASPTTTGKVERFHRTYRQEFLAGQILPSLRLAQKALDTWVEEYNTERPHQSLGMLTPAERFSVGRDEDSPMPPLDLSRHSARSLGCRWVSRTVLNSVHYLGVRPSAQRRQAPERRDRRCPGDRETPRGLVRQRTDRDRAAPIEGGWCGRSEPRCHSKY